MLRAGPKTGYDGALPDIEDDVAWFEYVTRAPLYTWQREELRAAMAPDRARTRYVQLARKNGKSYLAAAVAICQARRPGSHIYTMADSERNLNSALMREINDIVAASPILSLAYVPFKNKLEVPSTGSFIETRPNNFAATQSINPHVVILDECHLQKHSEIWDGLRMATAARPDGMLYGITTPGQDVNAPAHGWYESVRAGTMAGRIFEPSNPDVAYDDREQWALANPRIVDDPAFAAALEADHADLQSHSFLRYRLGMWTAGATSWLPYGRWDSLKVARELEPGERIWLGFDGSYSGDSTALVAITADGFVTVLGCWENPGKTSWRVPRQDVEDCISDAMAGYDVAAMLADPPYWQKEIAEWDRRWPGKVIEFPTFSRARMAPACTRFYTAVMEGRLSHAGDPRLGRHLANCVVMSSPMGDYVTKADKNSPAKIDLAVAAIVAHSQAAVAPPKRSRIFVL